MTQLRTTGYALGAVLIALAGSRVPLAGQQPASRYLVTWAGDADHKDSDFLATIDLNERGGTYGRVVATMPVGETGLFPHHTEHEFSPTQTLFANGFAASRSFLFDLHDPLHAKILNRWSHAGDLSFIHSFVRLPNGHVIATAQGHGPDNLSPGGIVEIDEQGNVVRFGSSADPTGDAATLRPYSLAVVPALDRVVVGLTVMNVPTWHPNHPTTEHDHTGNQIQVFRLSTLSLVRTIRVEDGAAPSEPRVLGDGTTVIVSSGSCRFYLIRDLGTDYPRAETVFAGKEQACQTPVVVGHYWLQAAQRSKNVFALDVGDPAHPRLVSELTFTGERDIPHWLASDGRRVVILNAPTGGEPRIKMATIDPSSGALALDEKFRDEGSSQLGVSFERETWPHGNTGAAIPHGTVFAP